MLKTAKNCFDRLFDRLPSKQRDAIFNLLTPILIAAAVAFLSVIGKYSLYLFGATFPYDNTTIADDLAAFMVYLPAGLTAALFVYIVCELSYRALKWLYQNIKAALGH